MTARARWTWIELILLAVGIACLGYAGLTWFDMRVEQARENRELDRILQSRVAIPSAEPATPSLPSLSAPRHHVLGRLDIPRVGVSATVREGDDAQTLRQAIGHIPGTALPGRSGNAGLAAHRDTFFRRLKDVRARDAITFTSPDGIHRYVVQETRIVEPTDTTVLDETPSASMTLVTCYPFNYIGSAPQRFVVRAVHDDGGTVTEREEATAGTLAAARQESVGAGARTAVESTRPAKAGRSNVMKAPARRQASERAKRNAFSRFFRAAARGLGLGPRGARGSARSESRDRRNPGR